MNSIDATDPHASAASQVALDYLAAMQARDIAGAESFLATDVTLIFPGSAPMTSLAQLLDWSKNRYRAIAKSIDDVDAFAKDDVAVVFIRGTLAGTWPDGTSFEGIRFIDRFEVKDGKILRQEVWNDLAEIRGR
ncbi:MAG: nuclear transport factor 2 family protein [Pseudomonadota bacterium]